jgi:hypothetical protein
LIGKWRWQIDHVARVAGVLSAPGSIVLQA